MTLNHRSVKLLYSHAHPSQLLILLCAVRPSIAAGFEAGSAAIHVNLQLQDFNWTRDAARFTELIGASCENGLPSGKVVMLIRAQVIPLVTGS